MPTQMNHQSGGGSYKTAPEATTPVKGPSNNFQGKGGSTYRSSRSKPQMNFGEKIKTPHKDDPTPGKSNTGNNNTYGYEGQRAPKNKSTTTKGY